MCLGVLEHYLSWQYNKILQFKYLVVQKITIAALS
jgi:hypothetical protein